VNGPTPTRITCAEQLQVLAAALVASVIAVWWSWSHQAFLLYGDAEAHIHIARRVFDSHRPGITQLGSVWLPLPHLLLVPFLAVDSWWRSGFAPVIPSAACYLLGSLGLYRLMRRWLSRPAAWAGLVFFAANPSLLYLQTTAMTEPLFLCELIWSVVLLVEWYEGLDRLGSGNEAWLQWAVIAVLVAAVYTRYDGWILAFLAWVGMAVCLWRRGRLFRLNFIAASVVLLMAPLGWMAYNAVVFRDWLDFMRGPYSAKAIEERTSASAVDPHPGWHNPWVAMRYFVQAAEMDSAVLGWGGFLFSATIFGTFWGWLQTVRERGKPGERTWFWTLLLWLPLPFYAYSVSYGSVPIFIPIWKPFSWYNTRYGMELLPALAFFLAFAVQAFLGWLGRLGYLGRLRPQLRWAAAAVVLVLLAANVLEILRQKPLVYVEAVKNNEARSYYNVVLADALRTLHTQDPDGVVLMDSSNFPSIVPHSGLTYRQTINESDKQFYWAALAAPAKHADIVLAFAGSEIDKAVKAHPEGLRLVQTFRSPSKGWDQLDASLYVSDTFPTATPPQP